MEHRDIIIVCGDPIKDIYVEEFVDRDGKVRTDKLIIRPGGSLNVAHNIQKILSETSTIIEHEPIVENHFKQELYTIIRASLANNREITLAENKKRKSFYEEEMVDIDNIVAGHSAVRSINRSALVLSDYNKGVLNRECYKKVKHKFDICVVDSKYRSINTSLFETSETVIWHATNQEFCPEFARNFDWVLHSNADKPVRILRNNKVVASLTVPNTSPVNTCGAGDTFTASVASFLLKKGQEITEETMTRAVQFAISCCQEVIVSPYTTATTKKL